MHSLAVRFILLLPCAAALDDASSSSSATAHHAADSSRRVSDDQGIVQGEADEVGRDVAQRRGSADSIAFEAPVLVAESSSAHPVHAWFPEGGAVVGPPTGLQAVLVAVRHNLDGGPKLPSSPTDEAKISWDGGRSYSHYDYDSDRDLTPTHLDTDGTLRRFRPGGALQGANKTSFRGAGQVWTAHPNKTLSQCEGPTAVPSVLYSGFPFPVEALTYGSAVISVVGLPSTLVQMVAYTTTMPLQYQELAAFRSTDSGRTFLFQQVVGSHNETRPSGTTAWQGPGENDLVKLQNGSLLTVFRVQSCHPYRSSRSLDGGGKVWTALKLLAPNVLGSVRPKLLRLPSGQVMLAGGRPGLSMWLSDDATAITWTRINIAAVHNRLATDPSWLYGPGFVNDTNVCSATTKSPSGCSCQHPVGPSPTTAYTSLLQVGPRQFLLQYDRLANGWKMPPGPWHKRGLNGSWDHDHTYSMRFTLKSDDDDHSNDDDDPTPQQVGVGATLVHLSLVPGASSSAIQVSFSTPKHTGCSTVQFWQVAKNGSVAKKLTAGGRGVTYAKASDTTHHVQLFGLNPDESYQYTCGCAAAGPAAGGNTDGATVHRFVAPPQPVASDALRPSSAEPPDEQPWSMLALADLGTYLSSNATVQLMAQDVSADYEFVLLGGDISYANGNDPVWLTYLHMIEPLAARLPWMVVSDFRHSPSVLNRPWQGTQEVLPAASPLSHHPEL
jgi:hypothetical protein